MTTFDETQHPRGQAENAGQFREKANSAPTDTLDTPEEPARDESSYWRILADRVDALSDSIAKANKRLTRAGINDQFTFTATESIWRDENNQPWRVADVVINRPAISYGRWQFVGHHEKTAGGAVISHFAGKGERVEADPSMRCDHCGQFRSRQKVYTLRDPETGETAQIGSSCVALFLGVKPEGLWALAAEVGDQNDRFDGDEIRLSKTAANAYDGNGLLLATIRQINLDGQWLSRSKAGMYEVATIDKVTAAFTKLTTEPGTAEELEEIAAVDAWVASLEPASDDDYLRNLKAAFTRDDGDELVISTKHAAIAASAVGSYRRHLVKVKEDVAREVVASKKKAEFVFQPGESLKGKDLELQVLSIRSGYDYGYGEPKHVTMMDAEGHVIYWKSSGPVLASVVLPDGAGYTFCPEAGDTIRIVGGSVKEHRVSDFNGDHETVVWRVKIAAPQSKIDEYQADRERDLAERAS